MKALLSILFDPLMGLSVLYGLVVAGVVVVIVTALRRIEIGHSRSVKELFQHTRFLELTTVLVVIISGTYLAWSDKLSDGVVALLSGIAGYVLGGLWKRQDENTPSPSPPPPKA